MRREDARRAILAEFRLWAKKNNVTNARGIDGFTFYGLIERDQPDLLDFRMEGDKWQTVHGWLSAAGLVSDGLR